MPQKRRKNKRKNASLKVNRIILALLTAIVILCSAVISAGEYFDIPNIPTWNQLFEQAGLKKEPAGNYDGLTVTFLDVGQGDSILLSVGETHALIDGGEAENADKIVSYLQEKGITKLDYVFATHPHSDHIGSLARVMKTVPAKTVVTPKIPGALTPTTNVYRGFLSAVAETGAKGVYGDVGKAFQLGEGTLRILGPINTGKDLNNCSLVIRLDYGICSFLFTGDAEIAEEKDLLASTSNLDVDVLKAGHHGSETSSSDDFLSAVSPKYAVISCGEGNQYGHPDSSLIQRFFNHDVTYYRTDQRGNITCVSDGSSLNFSFEKEGA